MLVKISPDGHVIVPPFLLEALGLGPGDTLELEETEAGFALKLAEKYVKPPRTPVDWSKYGTLRDKIPPGTPPWDREVFWDSMSLDKEKYLELYRKKFPESGY